MMCYAWGPGLCEQPVCMCMAATLVPRSMDVEQMYVCMWVDGAHHMPELRL